MSCLSSQGVGAAACANADVDGAASAAAATSAAGNKTVLIEILVILHSPSGRTEKADLDFLNKSRTPFSRQRACSPHRPSKRLVISRSRLRDYVPVSV